MKQRSKFACAQPRLRDLLSDPLRLRLRLVSAAVPFAPVFADQAESRAHHGAHAERRSSFVFVILYIVMMIRKRAFVFVFVFVNSPSLYKSTYESTKHEAPISPMSAYGPYVSRHALIIIVGRQPLVLVGLWYLGTGLSLWGAAT